MYPGAHLIAGTLSRRHPTSTAGQAGGHASPRDGFSVRTPRLPTRRFACPSIAQGRFREGTRPSRNDCARIGVVSLFRGRVQEGPALKVPNGKWCERRRGDPRARLDLALDAAWRLCVWPCPAPRALPLTLSSTHLSCGVTRPSPASLSCLGKPRISALIIAARQWPQPCPITNCSWSLLDDESLGHQMLWLGALRISLDGA